MFVDGEVCVRLGAAIGTGHNELCLVGVSPISKLDTLSVDVV
jgi:hypothetical protein